MELALKADISAIQSISSVPTILEAVAAMTGLRFVCIARVTEDSWTNCAVLDKLGFGLKVGDGLDVATTLCDEVRETSAAVVIDHASHDERYRDHRTPKLYGFESYISIPVFRADGEYFGTLCGLDPNPANLKNSATISTMTLFAQLISLQLDSEKKLMDSQNALLSERETAELREQFIAVLGHDLRTPLGSIINGAEILRTRALDLQSAGVVERVRRSALRIAALVDDVLDFTRGKMGGGIALDLRHESALDQALLQVVAELRSTYPERDICCDIRIGASVWCDQARLGQLLSNLLKNALVHGSATHPVQVSAQLQDGALRLAVSNQGPTIPPETIAQLFKPYWRGRHRGSNEGLGLGLFIVSEIARSHGGRLEVVSEGQSTSFIFTLPRLQA